jgi:putative toxin-antitoxin system antitoxin component (TIGR02293 family)
MSIAATLQAFTSADPLEQVLRIRRGVPARAWDFVASLVGLGKHELAQTLKLNPRTLQRRSTLHNEEGEKILRVFRVHMEATAMCRGNQEDARQWMNAPLAALGGNRPIDLLDTDVGAAQVLNVIHAVQWGVYL